MHKYAKTESFVGYGKASTEACGLRYGNAGSCNGHRKN